MMSGEIPVHGYSDSFLCYIKKAAIISLEIDKKV